MGDARAALLEYVNRPGYEPLRARALARKLGIKRARLEAFLQELDQLVEESQLRFAADGCILPAATTAHLVGVLRKTMAGDGYVILREPKPPRLTDDVYVDARDIGDAQTGDEVAIALTQRRRAGGARCARILTVLKRAATSYVGTYFEEDGHGFVEVDNRKFAEPIAVGDAGAKQAQPGDKVGIEMTRFPTLSLAGQAVLTKVFGPAGTPGADTEMILHEYGLSPEFPPAVLEDARRAAEEFQPDDLADREDLTGELIVTIDPHDARDFDDAISLDQTPAGHWRLGVHIADVGHFVRPNSPLDREAVRRATSVYLPSLVVPMLPEIISNTLASLQQGEVRFTKSVFIEFTPTGAPVDARVARTAIRVRRRFAYEQVEAFFRAADGEVAAEGSPKPPRVTADIRTLLERMRELAQLLRQRRMKAGSLDLSLPEIRVVLDREQHVVGAEARQQDESHRVIEEFMLAANVAVAELLHQRQISCLRRIHPAPREERLTTFSQFVESLGFHLQNPNSRLELQSVIEAARGTPLEEGVHFALLRSLKQATYAPDLAGHFALGFEHYCHFTSPIRRYPDLTIHRLVDQLIDQTRPRRDKGAADRLPDTLVQLGQHCSDRERAAEKAERELTRLKLLSYMATRLDTELDAVVTGVERFGLFCRGLEVPAEGFIAIAALGEWDYFDYEKERWCLTGRRTGVTIRLGDRVRVRVQEVDLDRRELEYALVKLPQRRPAAQSQTDRGGSRRGGDRRQPGKKGSGSAHPPARGSKKTSSRPESQQRKRRRG